MRLRNLLKGSNAHQTLTEWHPLEELDDEPAPAASGWRQDGPGTFHDHQEPCPVCEPAPEPVHWLETETKRGTPVGTIACSAMVSPATVVSVSRDDVTCDACKQTAAWKALCAAKTSRDTLCKFPARPGTDRCALPSHQRS